MDELRPSGLPKFAYLDSRTVGYLSVVRETLVSAGALKSLSVSSVHGSNSGVKMIKE